ncbi:hypothetical protein [Nocardia sp. NPDC058705]|uniref:hypothetical protein n=1 Tax=Nocardia sp. NPDC058705 TaxID=3346609 RepID=UPI0036B40F84
MITTSFDTALSVDSRHAQHLAATEHDRRLLQRYLAWPFLAVIVFEIACKSVLLVASIIEVPLMETTLSVVFPTAGERTVTLGAIAFLILYITLWDILGVRLAQSRRLQRTTPDARRGPGFATCALLVTMVAVVVAIAVLRTKSLADSAARHAVSAAIAASVDPLDAADLARIEHTAWWSAFWPDATFTVALMTMLALVALLVGFYSPTRHQALSLHLARSAADRTIRRAARADAAHRDATRRAQAQQIVAADRERHASALTESLDDRFERAKQLVRHLIAERQANPDATTTVFPPSAER